MIETVIKEIAFAPNIDQLLGELQIKDKKKMMCGQNIISSLILYQ